MSKKKKRHHEYEDRHFQYEQPVDGKNQGERVIDWLLTGGEFPGLVGNLPDVPMPDTRKLNERQ